MKRLKTVSEVIDRLGGNIEVADLTSRSSNAVSNWRGFGKFPANTYFVIRDELLRLDYTAPESLWAMQEPNPNRVKRKRNKMTVKVTGPNYDQTSARLPCR